MQYICRTVGLTKRYKDFFALESVSLNIKGGDIYGLIGKNGAGKTTLIKSIAGLIKPTVGAIELFGVSAPGRRCSVQRRIGYTIENPALYADMTARENLEVFCMQKDIDRQEIPRVLKLAGVSGTGKKKAGMFSLGMKQRLALAAALLGAPDFLVLDEPLNGLDPTGILELRALLTELNRKQGITILLSSHILSELHKLASCYGIVHEGKLLEEISTESLDKKCRKHISIMVSDTGKAVHILKDKFHMGTMEVTGQGNIKVYEGLENCAQYNRELVLGGVEVMEIGTRGESLESYFTSVIGGAHHA